MCQYYKSYTFEIIDIMCCEITHLSFVSKNSWLRCMIIWIHANLHYNILLHPPPPSFCPVHLRLLKLYWTFRNYKHTIVQHNKEIPKYFLLWIVGSSPMMHQSNIILASTHVSMEFKLFNVWDMIPSCGFSNQFWWFEIPKHTMFFYFTNFLHFYSSFLTLVWCCYFPFCVMGLDSYLFPY
jgi:hypothetical protein